MGYNDFISIHDIEVGSIWVAADGGSYGHYVVGKNLGTNYVLVKPFNKGGWCDGPDRIDWFKLQYRYSQVK